MYCKEWQGILKWKFHIHIEIVVSCVCKCTCWPELYRCTCVCIYYFNYACIYLLWRWGVWSSSSNQNPSPNPFCITFVSHLIRIQASLTIYLHFPPHIRALIYLLFSDPCIISCKKLFTFFFFFNSRKNYYSYFLLYEINTFNMKKNIKKKSK